MTALTAEQRRRERSIFIAIALDLPILAFMFASGIGGNSLTMLADAFRATLALALEFFTFSILRRIHRGELAAMDYGAGKLEQIANALIGISMLGASLWVIRGVLRLLAGDRSVGSPAGLAFAAIVGMVNLYINVLAWDGVRRAMGNDPSTIMDAQLRLRRVKLIASGVVLVALTIAALSTDHLVVVFADGIGSLFVAIYMFREGIDVLRTSIPDLLDRSAGTDVRQAVEEALATHETLYESCARIRSRKSGRTTFIDIALRFDPTLPLGEVQRRIDTLRASIAAVVNEADVSIATVGA
jgi:divalent metal cation (Fe/Co/Zn/Cd) transporter